MQLEGLGERCKLPQWGLGRSPISPQLTKNFVHIQGQNNSSSSNIFMGFAEEKIEHFAKLKQKEVKDTLEREKQVCLEKRNNKQEAQQRKCQKTIIQQEKFECFTEL